MIISERKNITLALEKEEYDQLSKLKNKLKTKSFTKLFSFLFDFYLDNKEKISELEETKHTLDERVQDLEEKLNKIDKQIISKEEVTSIRNNLDLLTRTLNLIQTNSSETYNQIKNEQKLVYESLGLRLKKIEELLKISSDEKHNQEVNSEIKAMLKAKEKLSKGQ